MTIGSSLFLIAVGAILRYAVTARHVWEIQVHTAGLILMLVGALGLILGLFLYAREDRAGHVPPYAP
jgi:hypothetical protein